MKGKKSCVPFLVSFSSFPVPSISGNGGFINTPFLKNKPILLTGTPIQQ